MATMRRREFLAQSAALSAAQPLARTAKRPRNVLLLIADDLGLFIPSYGDPNAVMPHIEQTAREGVRFTNAFCTTASCSASLAAGSLRPGWHASLRQRPGEGREDAARVLKTDSTSKPWFAS
jgi:hypothetical protein